MSRYVMGDAHGRVRVVEEVLDKSGFDFENDELIILGDVVDGTADVYDLIELILSIKHKIFIYGNHELGDSKGEWARAWFDFGTERPAWVHQGGLATMRSYGFDYKSVPLSHKEFLHSGEFYHIDDKNNIFVHGGFNPDIPIRDNSNDELLWNRSIIGYAMCKPIPGYNHVFIGHTTVELALAESETRGNPFEPAVFNNLVMLDTGGGWHGRLTLMDPDTLEYWQSSKQKKPRKWFDVTCIPEEK
jgi:Calcineurin-like phosphoesterase